MVYVATGTFFLWVSWIFQNGSASMSLFDARSRNGPKMMVNTLYAGAVSGLTAAAFRHVVMRTYTPIRRMDVQTICNGIMSGLVAISACCDVIEPWASAVVGFLAGFSYILGLIFLRRFAIDDPVEATCVHLWPGVWGLLATAIFHNDKGLIVTSNPKEAFTFLGV